MTDEWEKLGLLEPFLADLAERTGDRQDLVRESPLGFAHYYDSFVARRAADVITSYESDQPWFCWVGFGGPHEPWDAPEPFAGLFDPADQPEPLPPIRSVARSRPTGALLDGRLAGGIARLGRLSPADIAVIRANYAAKIALIDHHVGELLHVIAERGELDRTLVVASSDHGEMAGDHGLFNKSCFLQPAVTVPLVIRPPRDYQLQGTVVDTPVELIDIGATLVDAAGGLIDYPQWGHSLLPLLRGEAQRVREFAVSEQRGEIMAVGDRWKVAANRAGEIYLCTDLEDDPLESRNIAATRAARVVERTGREQLLSFLLSTQLYEPWDA